MTKRWIAVRSVASATVEAAWLAVIVILPLFFNPYSNVTFMPDKGRLVFLCLSVIPVMLLLRFLLRRGQVEQDPPVSAGISERLFMLLVVLYACWLVVTTCMSIYPWRSLVGVYERPEGLWTSCSYLVLFAGLCSVLRCKSQLERLLHTWSLVGTLVAIYAIVQFLDLDPFDWNKSASYRVAGSLGNPIFTGSFLAMTIPISVRQCAGCLMPDGPTRRLKVFGFPIALMMYVLLVLLQVAGLLLTISRGPLLAFMISSLFVVIIGLYLRRHFRLMLLLLGAIVLMGAVLVALPRVIHPDHLPKNGFGRLIHVLDEKDHSSQARIVVWDAAARRMQMTTPMQYPDGPPDTLHKVRWLTGFGPDTLSVVFDTVYSPQLEQLEAGYLSVDHLHNDMWDRFVMTGAIGVFLYLMLYLVALGIICRGVGLVTSRNDVLRFAGSMAGSLCVCVVLAAFKGRAFVLPALSLSVFPGLLVYLLISIKSKREETALDARCMLWVMIFWSISVYFIETQFGIALISSQVFFWILLALTYVLACYDVTAINPPNTPTRMTGSLIVCLILCTVIYVFGFYPLNLFSVGNLTADGFSSLMDSRILTFCIYIFLCMLLMYLLALSLIPERPIKRLSWLTGCAALILSLLWGCGVVLKPLYADMYVRMSRELISANHYEQACQCMQKALALQPAQMAYYDLMHDSCLANARATRNLQERDALTTQAVNAALQGIALDPFGRSHYERCARTYAAWAVMTEDERLRHERVNKAKQFFEKSIALSPGRMPVWTEYATFVLLGTKDSIKAQQLLHEILQRQPNNAQAFELLAVDAYTRAKQTSAPVEQMTLFDACLRYVQQANEVTTPKNPVSDRYRGHLMCADIYQRKQEWKNAWLQVKQMRKYAQDPKRQQQAEHMLQQLKEFRKTLREQRQKAGE